MVDAILHENWGRIRVELLKSINRFKSKLKEEFKKARGRNLELSVKLLNPMLLRWYNYFKYNEITSTLDELDGWIRRKLRCILWRQWKRPYCRSQKLMR